MVSIVHTLPTSDAQADTLDLLAAGLLPEDRERLERALSLVGSLYRQGELESGESTLKHALGMALIAASLNLDVDTRLAALLFAAADHLGGEQPWRDRLGADFGETVTRLVDGLHRLKGLRLLTRPPDGASTDVKAQAETLRKMLLAMVEDIRVVLLRLASRTQSLRYFTDQPGRQREEVARESLEIYAPLANRLGVWQLKWELEDLSFRFIEPETYRRIARMLDEKRAEREFFVINTVDRLKRELAASGIAAEVYGRPKHIYSIWNKMRGKELAFAEVYDVRALRVLVAEVPDCYAVLGLVHHLWQPVPGEFDDYIAHPKSNHYRSLHTAVQADDGHPFEVQIRTHEMHRHSELGVAAHWRYKEAGGQSKSASRADSAYDDKIAWLRQLLSWRDEITDSADWVQQFKQAALDDTIYVVTPQGRVIDLACGATPIDFAYRVHTDLGHRCRGARVDGQQVPLNTPLANGQRVEIVSVKQGGPSRDWLNPAQGYLATSRARQKVKQWFTAQDEAETVAQGRAFVTRELQREGQTQANTDLLAHKLGFKNSDEMYLAGGRGELGMRQIQTALRGEAEVLPPEPEIHTRRSKAAESDSRILVVGVGKILTQLGRCCKPVPPDAISGFVTRGKGVSIHRVECRAFKNMSVRSPERVIGAEWGNLDEMRRQEGLYAADIVVDAYDRQGLLRDISEVLSREKINVTAVKTQSKSGAARMSFTVELNGGPQLQRMLTLVREVSGVVNAWRG
ncbi:MAG: bifunctional (p)ppGpp synthetase/guanosine-3',5'-bis(diphosphate) 3'-pyrophosphohydrolase [Betaproteobacteria bacterium]|nr:bifunctional (p)ppGpp synthetase/guanosine-3',5'-bis(diphosphate) 3'-pyrophosphohydrolase [Betaproteobacteria bacterium]